MNVSSSSPRPSQATRPPTESRLHHTFLTLVPPAVQRSPAQSSAVRCSAVTSQILLHPRPLWASSQHLRHNRPPHQPFLLLSSPLLLLPPPITILMPPFACAISRYPASAPPVAPVQRRSFILRHFVRHHRLYTCGPALRLSVGEVVTTLAALPIPAQHSTTTTSCNHRHHHHTTALFSRTSTAVLSRGTTAAHHVQGYAKHQKCDPWVFEHPGQGPRRFVCPSRRPASSRGRLPNPPRSSPPSATRTDIAALQPPATTHGALPVRR